MMFRNYLRVLPSAMQLAIFMAFTALMFMVYASMTPLIIKWLAGAGTGMEAFMETGYKDFPVAFTFLNAMSLIVCFLIPSLIFSYLAHPQPAGYLGFCKVRPVSLLLWILPVCIGMYMFIMPLSEWLQRIDMGEWARKMQEDREQYEAVFTQNQTPQRLLLNILLVALTPAICEEVFFRGVLMRFLNSWFRKPALAIVAGAGIFAFVHASVYNFFPIVITGIILGWIYFKTGSIWLNILLHFLFNASQLVISYFLVTDTTARQPEWYGIVFFGVGILLLALSLRKVQKLGTPLPVSWSVVERDTTPDDFDITKEEQ